MSSAFKWAAIGLASLVAAVVVMAGAYRADVRAEAASLAPRAPVTDDSPGILRVCADPNNMPFSNDRAEGFENRIAEMVARDLGRRVEYAWLPQRRGFVRNTLRAGRCDVIIGVPAGFQMARVTRPYYRSTYVFVSRRDRGLRLRSLDDPRLKRLLIGIHAIGDDYANPPPAQALAARHIVDNIRGYSIYGDYSKPDPPRDLIDAVARGDVDVAIAWGPTGGYFAQHEPVALTVTALSPQGDGPSLPFVFDIAMGVRRDDPRLAADLNREIVRRQGDINRILRSYGVPLAGDAGEQEGAARQARAW